MSDGDKPKVEDDGQMQDVKPLNEKMTISVMFEQQGASTSRMQNTGRGSFLAFIEIKVALKRTQPMKKLMEAACVCRKLCYSFQVIL